MPFEKGKSGNPGGKPKSRVWRDAIERAIERRAGKVDLKGIDDLADRLLDAAFTGDMTAMKEFGDRIEGKAIQAVEHSIARTHEEELANLDNPVPDDSSGEVNTSPPP